MVSREPTTSPVGKPSEQDGIAPYGATSAESATRRNSKQMRPQKSIRRMLTYITPPHHRKAFALQATMYKGFVANGTTLIIELYEM